VLTALCQWFGAIHKLSDNVKEKKFPIEAKNSLNGRPIGGNFYGDAFERRGEAVSLLFIFTTAYVVALSGALMPGPMLTVTVKESLQQGWRSGLLICAGHGLAEICILVLFALGLNRLLHLQWMSAVIGIGGGLVLLCMGVDICLSALRGTMSLDLAGDGDSVVRLGTTSYLSPLKSGFISSVANPYLVIWWFTVGILYVTQSLQAGLIGLGSFYAGHILADLSWFVFIAAAVATGKRWLNLTAYRGILGVCGIFLVILAAYFIYRGISTAILL
jgi:threonine/homoserine/homoserine lactone efflux protein